ncbi:hypothetical protein CASFOL_011224 [Castilleja foliolosa]|uniref:Transposase n=1 Tax=Castilleja foliolosa TaxID=1961234 RepID=A0ABD3DZ08_9LAMI
MTESHSSHSASSSTFAPSIPPENQSTIHPETQHNIIDEDTQPGDDDINIEEKISKKCRGNKRKRSEGSGPYKPHGSRQTTLTQEGLGGQIIAHKFDQQRLDKKCLEWIIRAEQPFGAVEHPAFITFIKDLQPKFKIPSRKKIAKGVLDLFLTEKSKILSVIGNLRVSITTDTWTSIQNINYMVVTAHFLDNDWNLHKRIINFTKITSQRGEDIGRVLDRCLSDWGIQRVFSITVDNASANDKAIEYMKRRFKARGTLLLDGVHLHMRCACHIINLVVEDGIKDLLPSIEGIRNCVKFIHSSPARLDLFRSVAKLEYMDKMSTIPLDVVTRWNATYEMLSSAFKFKNVFTWIEEENKEFKSYFEETVTRKIEGKKVQAKREGPPVEADWAKAICFAHFLKKFYDATVKLSATKTPTSNLILSTMWSLQVEIENKVRDFSNPIMQSVAYSMKLKFDKYWGSIDDVNSIIFVSQALDPRYKFDMIEFGMEKIKAGETKIEKMKESITQCFNDLLRAYKEGNDEERPREVIADDSNLSGYEDDVALWSLQIMNKRKASHRVDISNEFDKYLNDPFESPNNDDFNLLEWWKTNSGRYPTLSKIAKDVFALPSSTVASENAFSLGGRVVDPFRASLTPKMVEALVCCSDWLRGEEFKFYKEPTDEQVEFYKELENIENVRGPHSDRMLPPPVSRPNIPRQRGGRAGGRVIKRRGRN